MHGTIDAVVNLEAEDDSVVLRLTQGEAERFALAIMAGIETLSRAEYYIRTGLSQPDVRALADTIYEAATGGAGSFSAPLPEGVEAVENPRRPRPRP
jgi:hypothetical protein